MNKPLFKKVLKELHRDCVKAFDNVMLTQKDTSTFTHKGYLSYTLNGINRDIWLTDIDYAQTSDEGKILPPKERALCVYHNTVLNNGDNIHKSIYVFTNDIHPYNSPLNKYSVVVNVSVNKKFVAGYTKYCDDDEIKNEIFNTMFYGK